MDTILTQTTKQFPGGNTTATLLTGESPGPFFRVTVITRLDGGSFWKEYDRDNLSLVAAEGLLAFYMR